MKTQHITIPLLITYRVQTDHRVVGYQEYAVSLELDSLLIEAFEAEADRSGETVAQVVQAFVNHIVDNQLVVNDYLPIQKLVLLRQEELGIEIFPEVAINGTIGWSATNDNVPTTS